MSCKSLGQLASASRRSSTARRRAVAMATSVPARPSLKTPEGVHRSKPGRKDESQLTFSHALQDTRKTFRRTCSALSPNFAISLSSCKKTLTLIQFDKILHGNTESPLTMTLATKSALEVWMLTGHAECLEDFEETPCSGQRQGFLVNHHDCTQAASTSP